jgi:hypothetical protein
MDTLMAAEGDVVIELAVAVVVLAVKGADELTVSTNPGAVVVPAL